MSHRFNVFDHFLISDTLYNNSIDSVLSLHDIDNLSDHEPLVLQLSLGVNCVGFRDRIYSPRVSWAKATDDNMRDYKAILSQKLQSINLPTGVLSCNEINCSNEVHFQQLNNYLPGNLPGAAAPRLQSNPVWPIGICRR